MSYASDCLIDHNAKIMEEYDCKIVSVWVPTVDWGEEIALDIGADTVDYDIIDINLLHMVDNIKAGFCNPWEYTGIDLSDTDKYGTPSYLRPAQYGEL